ncbi:monooxygenase [Ilyonectria robusta]|uniref:monooxygenase n=1 Tax=Ilyonectria robusta TaxID=1079257 RepID=UPI001E8D367A|nr:monooxygenase [Ilyonectria robusta]KAH8663235.1 monooxygenase [Ilyonectria robusta]
MTVRPDTNGGHNPSTEVELDVAIIGAGVSGINTAYYVQTKAPKGLSYTIFEARNAIGGTWDLWKFPGIRTDSDVYSYGFSWNPWGNAHPLAPAADIISYLNNSMEKHGIDKHVKFRHRVLSIDWSSKRSAWNLTMQVDNEITTIRARFIVFGTGYYDYHEPMHSPIPGLENFAGTVIRPQWWPEDLDYTDKNLVVIGSGATAVTIVPNVAEKAKHVTMLQRSPTYISGLPEPDLLSRIVRLVLPEFYALRFLRLRYMMDLYMVYYYAGFFPKTAKKMLINDAAKQLPPNYPVDPNFTPRYSPFEQRVCMSRDGDFYTSIRSGKASVVTDTIKAVTADEIQLTSGKTLRPDIIVAATGLKLQFGGGIKISVDGQTIDPSSKFSWQNCMVQDVPNMMFIFGYANAAWTLGAEVTSTLLVRLLRTMKQKGAAAAIPRVHHPESMKEQSLFNLTSTYVQDANSVFPKGGEGPFRRRQNYPVDIWGAQWTDISKGLELRR